MEAKIEDKNVSLDKITFRQLGFGQPVTDKELHRVSIRLTLRELQEAVSTEFDQFSRESKEDDKVHSGDTVVAPLRSLGYPTLASALKTNREVVEQVLMEYLFFELLEGVLGENEETRCWYAVNSLVSIAIGDDHATIVSLVYKIA